MKLIFATAMVCVTMVAPLPAQSIPQWTIDAGFGTGPRTTQADGIWYGGESSVMSRFAFGFRPGPAGRTALVVSGEFSPDLSGDEVSICQRAPNGTCYRKFEGNGGVTASIGLRHAALTSVITSAFLGLGNYNDHLRGFGELHVAVVEQHVGLTLAIRHMRWHVAGRSYWYSPFLLGVQFF